MPEEFMQNPGWGVSGGVSIPLDNNVKRDIRFKVGGGYNSGYKTPVNTSVQGNVEFNPFTKYVNTNVGIGVNKQLPTGTFSMNPTFNYNLNNNVHSFQTNVPIGFQNNKYSYYVSPGTSLSFKNNKVFNPRFNFEYMFMNNPQLLQNSGFGQR